MLFLLGALFTNDLHAQRPAPAETIQTLYNAYDFDDNSGIVAVAPSAFGASSFTSGTANIFSAGYTGSIFPAVAYTGAHFVAMDLDASPGNGSGDDGQFDWITTVPATNDDIWFSGIFFSRQQSTANFDAGDLLRISYSKDGGATFITDVISEEVRDAPLNFAGGKHYSFNLGSLPAGGDVHIRISFDNLNGGAEGVGCDDFRLYSKCPVQVSKRGYTVCNGATYAAHIPYTGASTLALTVTPNAGTAAADFTTAAGEIVVSGIPVGTDWSIDVAGGCVSETISGLSPAVCFPSTTCPATPTPPADAITVTTCLTAADAAAQDADAFADPTGATPFGTWSGNQGAVAYARANNLTDIVFEAGYYERQTFGGFNEHNLDITGLTVYGNGATIDGNGDGGTMQECFAILAANDITFYDLHLRDYMHTGGGAIQISGQTGIKFIRCTFDANDYGSDGVVIGGASSEVEFYCSQFINHIHEPGLGTSSAMSITAGTVKFIETDWNCNRRVGFGGALKITGEPIISFYNGTFSGNYTFSGNAGDGGAFYMDGGDLYIDGTSFICNMSQNGVGISGGGAIRLDGQNTLNANIINAYFSGNNDEGGGSPSGGYGGAINISETSADPFTGVIATSTFIENTAGRGGAIYIDNETDVAVLSSTIDNNTSNDEGGGGIYVKAGETAGKAKTEFTLWNSIIVNNTTTDGAQAGGVHIDQTETSINTTAVDEDDLYIGGNTICGNNSGSAFADYSVREDMEGSTGPVLRSTEFFGVNNIGTGRAYFDIIDEDYSFGCTPIAPTAAVACPACTTVNNSMANCGNCPSITAATVSASPICSGNMFDVNDITHTADPGDLQLVVNLASDGALTATQLYNGATDNSEMNLGTAFTPTAAATMTSQTGLSLPANTTNASITYNLYVILAAGNANIMTGTCEPFFATTITVLPTPEADITDGDPTNGDGDGNQHTFSMCNGGTAPGTLNLISGINGLVTNVTVGANITGVSTMMDDIIANAGTIETANLTNTGTTTQTVVYTICPYNNGPDGNDDSGNTVDSGDGLDDCVATTVDNGATNDGVGSCVTYTVTVLPTPEADITDGDPTNGDGDNNPHTITICGGDNVSGTLTLIGATNGLVTSVTADANVTGVTTAMNDIIGNTEIIETAALGNTGATTQMVVYTICPYNNGPDGNDDSGTMDDCIAVAGADNNGATDGVTGSCVTYTVTILPAPEADITDGDPTDDDNDGNQHTFSMCSGGTAPGTFTLVSGTNGLVTDVTADANIAGVSTTVNAILANGATIETATLTNTGTTAQTVVYTICPYNNGLDGDDDSGADDDCLATGDINGATNNGLGSCVTYSVTVLPVPEADITDGDPNNDDNDNNPHTITICGGDNVPSTLTLVSGTNGVVTAVTADANITGVSTAMNDILGNGDLIETAALGNIGTTPQMVVYTICPYNNGPDGVDNSGTMDDCIATAGADDNGATDGMTGSCVTYTVTILPVAEADITDGDPTDDDNDGNQHTFSMCSGGTAPGTFTLVSGTNGLVTDVTAEANIAGVSTTVNAILANGATIETATLTNTGTTAQTVVYTICPYNNGLDGDDDSGADDDCLATGDINGATNNGLGSCVTYTITILPTPEADITDGDPTDDDNDGNPHTFSMCSGGTAPGTLTLVSGTNGLVTNVTAGANITGVSTAMDDIIGNGVIIETAALTNTGTTAQTVIYTICPYNNGPDGTDDSGTMDDCLAMGDNNGATNDGTASCVTYTVTVLPAPEADITDGDPTDGDGDGNQHTFTMCSGGMAPGTLTLVSGTNGLVTSVVADANVTGVATAMNDILGNGATIETSALNNTGATAQMVVYTICPYNNGPDGTDNSGTMDDCIAAAGADDNGATDGVTGSCVTYTVTILPVPEADITDGDPTNADGDGDPHTFSTCSGGTAPGTFTLVNGTNGIVTSVVAGADITGVTTAMDDILANGEMIETAALNNNGTTTQTVVYTVCPYNNGSNGDDDDGMTDDCVAMGDNNGPTNDGIGSCMTYTVTILPTPEADILDGDPGNGDGDNDPHTIALCDGGNLPGTLTLVAGTSGIVTSVVVGADITGVTTVMNDIIPDGGLIESGNITYSGTGVSTVVYTICPYNNGANTNDEMATSDDCVASGNLNGPTDDGMGSCVTYTLTLTPCCGTPEADITDGDPTDADGDGDQHTFTMCSGGTAPGTLTIVSGDNAIVTNVDVSAAPNVTGVSTATDDFIANGGIIEPNALLNTGGTDQVVVYTICPYNFGSDMIDDMAMGDDCVAMPGVDDNGPTDEVDGSCVTYTVTILPTPESDITDGDPTDNDGDGDPHTFSMCSGGTAPGTFTLVNGTNGLVTSVVAGNNILGVTTAMDDVLGNGATIETGILSNNGTAVQTVVYTVCPYNNGADGTDDNGTNDDCLAMGDNNGATDDGIGSCVTYTVTVLPAPEADVTDGDPTNNDGDGDDHTLTICSGDAVPGTLTIPSGTNALVTNVVAGTNITGVSTSVNDILGNGATIEPMILQNTSTAPEMVTYTICPYNNGIDGMDNSGTMDDCIAAGDINGSTNNGVGSCITYIVTVNPLPVFDLGADIAQCQGSGSITIGVPDDGVSTYQWAGGSTATTSMITIPDVTMVNTNFALTVTTAGCSTTDALNVEVFEPVVILCRPPVNTNADEDACGATIVPLLPPVVIDGETATMTIINDAPTFFPIGTTAVTWTITNGNGCSASCTQDVTVNDLVPPTIECGNAFYANTSWTNCGYPSSLLEEPTVSDNCGSVTITYTGATFFEPGMYMPTWTATDANGNSSSCMQWVNVFDTTDPKLLTCPENIEVEAQTTNGSTVTWTEPTAMDNCPGDIIWIASHDSGDAFPLGVTDVVYTAYDQYGNTVDCEFTVTVTPVGDPLIAIAGMMANEAIETIQDVAVSVNGGMTEMQMTLEDGLYHFNVPFGDDYSITPEKDINPLNGVSTFDLVMISKHILGIQALDSPYKLIAADVNKSNAVTTLDLVQLQKLILLMTDNFANNTSWRFIPQAYEFIDPTNPFGEDFPEVINFNNLSQSELNADFIGVKVGDVNGNAVTNMLLGTDDRTDETDLKLQTKNIRMQAGETYEITINAADFEHLGMQFTLNFDTEKVVFENIESDLAKAENFGLSLLDDGAITVSWFDPNGRKLAKETAIIRLTLIAQSNTNLSEVLNINSRFTTAEAYSMTGEIQNVALTFEDAITTNFKLYQNVPNPFSAETFIGFDLPTTSSATLIISDVSGKTVYQMTGDFAKGYNQIELTKDDLPTSGVWYYQLKTATDFASGKLVLIK